MELLERQRQLAELEAALRDASLGRGSLVLVTGEAGAGKSALVERLTQQIASPGRVLIGLCDDLLTPRPLGPFRDMAGQAGQTLERVIGTGTVVEFHDALIEELGRPPHPVVTVIEDAHWADEATLDALQFIGRRIEHKPALLIVTYRDDEVSASHPLRLSIGAISAGNVRRVRLGPLSRYAVERLAGHAHVDELYMLTGGNPFYVTEMLAARATDVPPSVQDAVLARVGRLDHLGRECIEFTSVVPTRAERWLLEGCGVSSELDRAERVGILRVEGNRVSFSHELARRAVEKSLPAARRQEINRRVLDVLAAREMDPARLAHHAAEADDSAAVVRFAPVAARRAAALESHREAVDHFEQALHHSALLSTQELADLLDDYARECYLVGHHDRARSALTQVIEMHAERGDHERRAASLTLLSDVLWFLGRGGEAKDASVGAITTLEQRPPNRVLARAYSQRAKLAIEARRADEAILWGEKAVDLARCLGDSDVLVHSLNVVGSAHWIVPPFDNTLLYESLEVAKEKGLTQAVGRAYANLAEGYIHEMDYERAMPHLKEGLEFCEANELVTGHNILLVNRAVWHLEQGRWTEAEGDLLQPLESSDVSRITALRVLALIQARRGSPSAKQTFEEAQRLAQPSGESRNLIPLAFAAIEEAWLRGNLNATADAFSSLLEDALESGSGRWIGEAALWLRRAGRLHDAPPGSAEAYSLQVSGEWKEAATSWRALNRPYEEADALSDAPGPEPLMHALRILDRLGAARRGALVRRRLTEMGVRSVPRGPRGAARISPAGLTARQTTVLTLLAEGLTYREIAERLYVSVKTVDHHVSAVRDKLGARTRADAVAAARRLGMLPPEDEGIENTR